MTGDNDAITLKDAAQLSGFSIAALRAEANAFKIGRRLYTTIADLEKLRSQMKPIPITKPLSEMMFVPAGVYIVGFSDYVKIGWSSAIEFRLKQLEQNLPVRLTIYRCFEGTVTHERALHRRFKEYRLEGEWFRFSGDLAAWIKQGCID